MLLNDRLPTLFCIVRSFPTQADTYRQISTNSLNLRTGNCETKSVLCAACTKKESGYAVSHSPFCQQTGKGCIIKQSAAVLPED